MSKKCPFCGSIRIVETPKRDTSICLVCRSFLKDKSKPTVFDRITQSPEVLADAIVYEEREHSILTDKGLGATFPGGWTSSIIEYSYGTKSEAIAATVAKLKEIVK